MLCRLLAAWLFTGFLVAVAVATWDFLDGSRGSGLLAPVVHLPAPPAPAATEHGRD